MDVELAVNQKLDVHAREMDTTATQLAPSAKGRHALTRILLIKNRYSLIKQNCFSEFKFTLIANRRPNKLKTLQIMNMCSLLENDPQ